MNLRQMMSAPLVVAAVLWSGETASAQAPPTVWHALGIPQAYSSLRDNNINKFGRNPQLEKKPPLKRIADPENLASKNPAIKKAAEIKAEEDLKPQKIKALKYLASIGCGCYEGVTEAFIAALEDCTEEVRYVAALSIKEAAGNQCSKCNGSCCTKELTEKMVERAYERDEEGCYYESSERVREALKEAICVCCPNCNLGGYENVIAPDPDVRPTPDSQPIPPDVRPTPDSLPPGTTPTALDRQAIEENVESVREMTLENATQQLAPIVPAESTPAMRTATQPTKPLSSSRRGWQHKAVQASAEEVIVDQPAEEKFIKSSMPARLSDPPVAAPTTKRLSAPSEPELNVPAVSGPIRGSVSLINKQRGLVEIRFADNAKPAKGDEVAIYHDYLLGREMLGYLTVVGHDGDRTIASFRGAKSYRISLGDEAVIDNPGVTARR